MISLAKGLVLPSNAVTQTFAFMGKRGAGKTYAAGKLVEELVGAGAQVVVIDPVGNWWGLRLAADGKGAGLAIPVLGGDRGDLPLAVAGGALVADLAVETGSSFVLDVSHFSKTERQRFVTDFAERLFQRKKAARSPIHLVLEEARLFVPQRTMPGQERMLGAMEDLIRLGRNYGIGVSLLDQRPQSVNKDALNQSEVLLAFQLIGSHERKAIAEWAEDKGVGKDGVKRLSELERGQAILWSPTWLKRFEVVSIGKKRTFDASSTPEVGDTAPARKLAPVDLDALRCAMEAVEIHAKADDPKALRRRIAELEKELQAARAIHAPQEPSIDIEPIRQAIRHARDAHDALAKEIMAAVSRAEPAFLEETLRRWESGQVPRRSTNIHVMREARGSVELDAPRNGGAYAASRPQVGRPKPEQRILDALAWLDSIGVNEPEVAAVAFLAGYRPGGGAFNNPRGALRSAGLVEYLRPDRMRLTEAGRAQANKPERELTTEELHRAVSDRLPGPERKILAVLLDAWPGAMGYEDLAAASGYAAGGGAFNNPRGRLRTLGLVEYPAPRRVVARDILFPGARP